MQIYEIIIFVNMKFIYPFIFFLFVSCGTNIEKQKQVNIYRFEDILFNSTNDNIEKTGRFGKRKLETFLKFIILFYQDLIALIL